MKDSLIYYFHQQLDQLEKEILAYQDEDAMWLQADGINNSAGNLVFHLIGNLNHFIGFALGNTGYERDRDFEFTVPFVKQEDLINGIHATKTMIEQTIRGVEDLEADYPEVEYRAGVTGSIAHQLLRLLNHLAYHLGQINYHRRMLDGQEVVEEVEEVEGN